MSNATEDTMYEAVQWYRTLLVKYIRHVARAEGVDFITDGYSVSRPKFTKAEIKKLEELAQEAQNDNDKR